MKTHWMQEWENEKDNKEEIVFYEKELDNSLSEYQLAISKIKIIEYRIAKIRDRLRELN